MDWLKATAKQQGDAIGAGVLDPVAQTEAYLETISAHPDHQRIFARLTPERALAEAEAARQRANAGLRRGRLDGVSLVWKDNIDSAGIATEAGSQLLAGRLPKKDADILATASDAGMVCIGKTHMTELAFSGLGTNTQTATPPNAHDPELLPGGSSSGTGVAVALGMGAAGIGTDTGGSIRLPSAWNNITGFKPTAGVLSGRGLVPLCESFDAPGPMARSVEDCTLIFTLLAGLREPDFSTVDVSGMNFLVLDGLPFEGAEAAPVAAFDAAIEVLAASGAKISRLQPKSMLDAMRHGGPVFSPEAYGLWRDVIEAAPDRMNQTILSRFRSGATMLASDFVKHWQELRLARVQWAQDVAAYDAVLLPSSPLLPVNAKRALADAEFFVSQNLLALRNTRIGNVLGLPAISLPTGVAGCGMMAMGHAGGDLALLRVATAMEVALAG